MQSPPSATLRTMVARISPGDIVIYANSALAAYLGVDKKRLIGTPLDVLAARCHGEVAACFARPESGRTSNHLVTDDNGRVFEAKLYSDGGVLDIVLDEVTSGEAIGRELRASSGTSFESLTEDEIRTARHPERRYLTVLRTQLRGLAQFTERLAPMEVRLMVNSFVEEACDSVFETGCTVAETSGDSILALFGAPRYFADHPLRAIRAACDQMQKAGHLHAGFYREGKELPPCSCGLWTGDTLVATLGNSVWQHYTGIGMPVDLATRLCQLARPGEVLLPEHTLTHLLRTLPEGWEHVRAESEFEPDMSDFQWSGDEIVGVPEHLKKVVYLLGPGVQDSTDNVELYFDYLWAFRVPGRDQVVPILRVLRPTLVGDSLELREDNVVTTQAVQTLGKYKLIEVIGTGGMGKVWRSVDRFGNAVAIKVLHSNEGVTDAQLRRFRREAEVMAKLPHRNICRVYEMNEFDGIQYIAMEFVAGLPLSDLLYEKTAAESSGQNLDMDLRTLISSLRLEKSHASRPSDEDEDEPEPAPRSKTTRILPIEQTLSIILKICDAVQFAHEHGVLHRDLKPGNILLREDGEPLVADFGLAKMNDPDATHSLSVSGHVVGTLENMSPEQAESSKDVDERADVYSIGTMLYQMLTGRRHFEASGNIVSDAQSLKTHEPVRPRALNAQIDPDLEIITLKALRNDPVERYRSVAALEADIQHYRRGEVISARPVTFVEVSRKMILRNRALSAAIAASVLISISGVLAFLFVLQTKLAEAQASEKIANELRADAVMQTRLAKEAQKQAEAQEAIASENLRDKLAAEDAANAAEESGISARKETEEEKAKRAEVESELARAHEDFAKQREEAEAEAARLASAATEASLPTANPQPFAPDRDMRPVHDAFMQANQIFNLQLSPYALQPLEDKPEEVIKLLTKALDFTTQALVLSPDFFPAWMLKGRLHLSLMEYNRAVESFAQAEKSAAQFPGPASREDPAGLAKMASELSLKLGNKYKLGAELLIASPDSQNQNAGRVLFLLADKPNIAKFTNNPSGPLGRAPTAKEAALSIKIRNGPDMNIYVKAGGLGTRPEIVIWGAKEVKDLSPLAELKEPDLGGLTISGAQKIDWTTIYALTILESLDLSHCALDSFPITPHSQRSFLRLKSLGLAGTHISRLDFIRSMPTLEKLDITDTLVTDLSPLLAARVPIHHLRLGGLNPANLRVLTGLPLDSVTFSPMLLSDKTGLNSLRLLRRLAVLRSPDDPENQSAAEFWRKFDSGAYQTSN